MRKRGGDAFAGWAKEMGRLADSLHPSERQRKKLQRLARERLKEIAAPGTQDVRAMFNPAATRLGGSSVANDR